MSKIAVFGANGFIGRNLTLRLANSHDEIIAFDRYSAYQRDSSHPFDSVENIRMVIGDFLNRNDVSNALQDVDYVFHLVSMTTPATADSDPFIDIETNLRSSVELFELCTQHNIKKVVFLSSGGAIYGDRESDRISEDVLPLPQSPYGISKLTIEHYLRYFKHVAGLDYIVYRVANPYGYGQNIHGRQGVIPIFMNHFLTNKPITIYGDGSMVRDYLYIDDLIEMIVGSYARTNKFSEYNLGSGQGYSVNEIIESLEKLSGLQVEKKHVDTPPTFVHRIVMDTDRFVTEFGIKPTTKLVEGIGKTWEYVKAIS